MTRAANILYDFCGENKSNITSSKRSLPLYEPVNLSRCKFSLGRNVRKPGTFMCYTSFVVRVVCCPNLTTCASLFHEPYAPTCPMTIVVDSELSGRRLLTGRQPWESKRKKSPYISQHMLKSLQQQHDVVVNIAF